MRESIRSARAFAAALILALSGATAVAQSPAGLGAWCEAQRVAELAALLDRPDGAIQGVCSRHLAQ